MSAQDDTSRQRPLDALLPELASAPEPLPMTPLHPRVMEVEDGDVFDWLLICWSDPGGAQTLLAELTSLVEATLLAHLSLAPARCASHRVAPRAIRLAIFEPIDGVEEVLPTLGFRPVEAEALTIPVLAALRDEAHRVGFAIPEAPIAIWEASLERLGEGHGERLSAVHKEMAKRMGDDVWGATPGGPSKLLAELLEQKMGEEITPSLDGLSVMELLLIQQDRVGIGWIEPMLFQGLCDFVGVVVASALETDWQWAVCEVRADGLNPPPHYRVPLRSLREGQVGLAGGSDQVPVALHIVRAHIMPPREGESAGSLVSWLRELVGG